MLRFTLRGAIAIVLSLVAPFAAAQVAPQAPLATPLVAPLAVPAPPTLLTQFDVSAATVQSLLVPAGSPTRATVDVVLAGVTRRIVLAQHEVRAPGFQLWDSTPAGLQPVPRPPCVTYRGFVEGDPASDVAATIIAGSVTVYARLGNGELWIIQPVVAVQPNVGAALHVVFRGVDCVNLPVQCGVQAMNLPVPQVAGEDALYLCDLAIETDYPFYQQNGYSVTNTQNDVTGIVNAMNVIYERDVDIRLVVSQMIVNTTTDAYTTSVANSLLVQFRNRWNSVNAGVPRDVAHLFTGRNVGAASGGTIGIAYLNAVCNVLGNAYGLSQNRFSTNYNWRVAVTAHEIGHNFGAGHCNNTPPCGIMCSGIGGCGNNTTAFGAAEINQIVAFRQSIGCLTLQATAPVITGASPVSIKTANPAQVTLTGSGFIGSTQVNVGNTFTTQLQVVSDTQLRFTPPTGLGLGLQTISVQNGAGTSNNSALLYTTAIPAELVVPAAVIGGNTVTWSMGGVNGDYAFLVISLLNTTSPWVGPWNIIDSPVVLWVGGLDARGMATYSFPVPSMVFNGLQVYSQLLDIVGGSINVRSVSAVKSTLVVL